MLDATTNFACLMDLLGVKSVDLCKAADADKTLVSRWRSGKRKLVPDSLWAQKIAAFFAETDETRPGRPILEVLHAYYPAQPLEKREDVVRALMRWLTEESYKEAEYQKDNAGLFGRLMRIIESLSEPEPEPEPLQLPQNTAVYGLSGVQGAAIMCAELVLASPEPKEVLYVCPEGLDMFTRDPKFGDRLMDMLMKMFAAGHTMSVVLRTDYKMTDVSLFSGRWLVAHLLGYIKSYYFDDFKQSYSDKMLSVAQDVFVYHVYDDDDGKILTTVKFDSESMDAAYRECRGYMSKSKQRFHYSLFESPDGFLHGAHPQSDRPCYQFARLPYFGIANDAEFRGVFQLDDGETELLRKEFTPLLWDVTRFSGDIPVRYVFCENDIEETLLKARSVSQELSAITGRRVNMTTKKLAEQLVRLKTLLEEYKNFEVCFLPDEVFEKLTMQIIVYADRAAVGWVAGGKSTACRDYTNVNALFGFCDAVWDKIPAPVRTRRAARKKLDMWLEKAKRYGVLG